MRAFEEAASIRAMQAYPPLVRMAGDVDMTFNNGNRRAFMRGALCMLGMVNAYEECDGCHQLVRFKDGSETPDGGWRCVKCGDPVAESQVPA